MEGADSRAEARKWVPSWIPTGNIKPFYFLHLLFGRPWFLLGFCHYGPYPYLFGLNWALWAQLGFPYIVFIWAFKNMKAQMNIPPAKDKWDSIYIYI